MRGSNQWYTPSGKTERSRLGRAGKLFGQRNMHMIAFGSTSQAIPFEQMPVKNGNGHGRIFVETNDEANAARNIILGEAS
jgi:hypothetical protein